MSERNGLIVRTERAYTGKLWFYVETPPGGSPVSFRDWFDMARALGICEIEKYAGNPQDPAAWDRWAAMPRGFLWDCFDLRFGYPDLAMKYRLPR